MNDELFYLLVSYKTIFLSDSCSPVCDPLSASDPDPWAVLECWGVSKCVKETGSILLSRMPSLPHTDGNFFVTNHVKKSLNQASQSINIH